MKAVITIFQCKRVVLPYIFMKYCYPKMKKIFPGEMKEYLIQHINNLSKREHATAKINESKYRVSLMILV